MKTLKSIAFWLGILAVVAFALLFYETDLLWKVQQHNVFLNSALFFKQMMVVPGGMLSWTGAFLTQFFYYPWVGVTLLCCCWLLLMWLTKKAFNLPDKWLVLTLAPEAILLIANMGLGYWVYIIKLRGYFYVPTLGVTVGTALLWAFRKLPEKWWIRATYIVAVTLAFYPLMGVYALVTTLLMGLWTWRLSTHRAQNGIQTCVSLLSIVAIPLIYYRFVYYETNFIDIYRTALPDFSVNDEYPDYYIPYYALGVCFLLLTLFYRNEWKEKSTKPIEEEVTMKQKGKEKRGTKKGKKENMKPKPKKPILQWMLQGCVAAVAAGCVYHFWYKDDNFHHELRMQRCVEQADWEGVVEEGAKQNGEPTRAIVMMHNLALNRLGSQCDEMYKFPKGSNKPNTPLPIYMYHIAGRMMLYQYGFLNDCHFICMEEGVEAGWSMELLQYMTRCAILNKEPQAARKFLDLLRQTQFYGEWADHMEKLLQDSTLLAKDKETGPITHMLHYQDHLDTVGGYVERFIMGTLAQHDADDLYFQQQAVLAAMWTREPSLFWPRFQHYVQLTNSQNIPRIFQEAAWLFANLEGREGLERWSLQQGIKESFQGFMQLMENYRNQPNEGLGQLIYEHYGTTYYFEFFFLRDITYY